LPNYQIELELGGVGDGGGKEHNFVFSNLWVLLVCRCGHHYNYIRFRFWIELKPTIMTILVSKQIICTTNYHKNFVIVAMKLDI
jgi:hypothetical protein